MSLTILEMEMGLSATKSSQAVPAGDLRALSEFSEPRFHRVPFLFFVG